jgi:uncharacterized membrane protein YjfL (UPF0719 family)
MNSLIWLSSAVAVLGQTASDPEVVTSGVWNLGVDTLLRHLIAACVFALVGVCVLAVAIWVMVRVVPFSMRKEIEEDQNTALGIIVGSIILGISLIIAAAIMG